MSSAPCDDSPVTRAIVIPAEGPLRDIQLEQRDGSHLTHLQELVGGYIEPLRVPEAFDPTGRATCYVNEEGNYTATCLPNLRATDFLVPGVGLRYGGCVLGTMVLVGFDPGTGEHLPRLPDGVVRRAKLIASESGAGWDSLGAEGSGGDGS